ncbi:MAG: hypothetical protein HONBIEJF_02157 [Fimbriimonadaceae bacterium]|nr:hypothetical protein [Fimbriimonadaceae bacterium]
MPSPDCSARSMLSTWVEFETFTNRLIGDFAKKCSWSSCEVYSATHLAGDAFGLVQARRSTDGDWYPMAMRILVRAAVLAVVALSFGCAAKDKIVGIWNAEIEQMGVKQIMTMNMSADKKMEMTIEATAPQIGAFKMTANGTYVSKENGKTITPTIETVAVDNKQLESMKDMITKGVKDQFNKELTPNWKSDDEFTLDMQGAAVTFKRKK